MINSPRSAKIIKSFSSYLITKGIWTPPRNIRNLHNRLVEEQRVLWFDNKLPKNPKKTAKNKYNYNNLITTITRNIENKINDH